MGGVGQKTSRSGGEPEGASLSQFFPGDCFFGYDVLY